jgi:hypothetical protein
MLNPFKDVNWHPDLAARRKFAVSLIIGFPILAAVLATITRVSTHAWKPGFVWLAVIGLTAGVVLWLLPQIARPFYVVWYFLGCCAGIVVGNVLFSAFYYLVMTPIGLVMRLGGRDPLGRRFDRGTVTYWRDAEKGIDPARYYRQF